MNQKLTDFIFTATIIANEQSFHVSEHQWHIHELQGEVPLATKGNLMVIVMSQAEGRESVSTLKLIGDLNDEEPLICF